MPLRVALVASELTPFAKTGGLGDVVAAIAKWLRRRGHDVRPFLPLYGNLKEGGQSLRPVGFLQDVPVRLGPRVFSCSVLSAPLPGTDLPVYFVRNPELYGRAETYSGRGDEHLRFAALSKASIECCQRMGFAPDVYHCNDWHTSLVPLMLKTEYEWDRLFRRTRTLLTIHNVGYQGSCPSSALRDLGMDAVAGLFHQDHLREGKFSFLETGILHADALSTVSVTHAREMATPEYGMGLDGLLRARRSRFVGIVNGIDPEEWDPAQDRFLSAAYSADDPSGKAACRSALLSGLGLPDRPETPVLAVVSRLTAQKGFDLCFDVLPEMLSRREATFVALGTGERRYEELFRSLERRFPTQARFVNAYSNETAHRIEAGADLFLMPSLYEPCGLNQMYSLRYGTLPIVRKTGGLADTVEPWDRSTGRGNGFVFEHYSSAGLRWALDQALLAWRDRPSWRRLQQNAMRADWSWDRQILEYERLYAAMV